MHNYIKYLLLIFIACSAMKTASAQTAAKIEIIQLSGVVFTADSLDRIPYVTIRVKGSNRGTVSDVKGFFSLAILKTDTLIFTAVGFTTREYVIPNPENVKEKLTVAILMNTEFYNLRGVTIQGLTRDGFRQAFLDLEIPEESAYAINPSALPKVDELRLPPPTGLAFSPTELIKEIPFIKRIIQRKKQKQFSEEEGGRIPKM